MLFADVHGDGYDHRLLKCDPCVNQTQKQQGGELVCRQHRGDRKDGGATQTHEPYAATAPLNAQASDQGVAHETAANIAKRAEDGWSS